MLLGFTTKRNANGNRKILVIDTDKKEYARDSRQFSFSGIEIKSADMKSLERMLIWENYTKVDFL